MAKLILPHVNVPIISTLEGKDGLRRNLEGVWYRHFLSLTDAVNAGSSGSGSSSTTMWTNVKTDFSAVGDGSTDDHTAIQAAITAVRDAGGGVVYFPAGRYKNTAQLTLDNTGDTSRFSNRVIFLGDGSGSTSIEMTGVAGPLLACIGSATYVETHLRFEGLRLTGSNFAGSVGLAVDKAAFLSTRDFSAEAFDYNFFAVDVEQALFERSNFRWGNNGLVFQPAVATTSPNSLTFVECCIANNATTGITIANPNAIAFFGGSLQYNGTAGVAGEYGAKFIDPGDGYGNIGFHGTIFEGNGGDADVEVLASFNPSVTSFFDCSFIRPNATNYATNNIRMSGAAATQVLNLSGNTFRSFGAYVPNAGRPYLSLANAAATLYDNGSNYYQSATEAPATSGSIVWGKLSAKTTSNTNLRFSFVGSDNVTRVADVTLA
jgi:hypothetical protein